MEYLQTLLLTTNSILSPVSEWDLYYIFSAFVFVWYIIFHRSRIIYILKLFLILAVYTGFAHLISQSLDIVSTSILLLQILLNITLMIFVVYNLRKWNLLNWIWAITLVHGFETAVALCMRDSRLWEIPKYSEGMFTGNLKLFYPEPAALSFVCGLLIVFYVYQLISKKFSWKIIVGSLVCLVDLFMSSDRGGIFASLLTIAILLAANGGVNKIKTLNNPRAFAKFVEAFVMILIIMAGVMVCSPLYGSKQMIMAEGGAYGFLLICGIVISLLVWCVLYGSIFDASVLIYIAVIQLASGRFKDSIYWLVYGWIVADCIYEKKRIKVEKLQKQKTLAIKPTVTGIIGSKGCGNYGGYETFVDKLTEYHQNNENIKYLIACKANGQGAMDESKLRGAVPISENEFMYHNARCFKVKVPQIGSAQAIVYDLLAIGYCIKYFKKHKVEKPILYVLTCRIGPFMGIVAKMMHDMDGKYYVNPDGNEWRRDVWKPWIRRYWKLSERLMIKHADKVICDSKNIQTYINTAYGQYKPNTTYIAYGAEISRSILSDDSPKLTEWYQTWGLKKKAYYLVVGRFVPENNYETMIREYMKCNSKKDFAIITNVNQGFLDSLEERLHFSKDNRIKFVGTVYNQNLLKKIRENAYGYFHGHEVGGTNPSLLEALSSTDLNLLLNVGFNRECGEDGALYWNKSEGNLASIIDKADRLSEAAINELSKQAKRRIKEYYSWEFIASEYEKALRN